MKDVPWQDKALALWPDESLSTRQIAEACGITNNQLCGHAQRRRHLFPKRATMIRGINLWSAEDRAKHSKNPQYKPPQFATTPKKVPKPPQPLGGSVSIRPMQRYVATIVPETLPSLSSLTPRGAVTQLFPGHVAPPLPIALNHRCCWVVENNVHEQFFCDAPAPVGSSWCQEHARIVFTDEGYDQWSRKHGWRRAA